MKRFFIVYYSGIYEGNSIDGNVSFETEDHYINRLRATDKIKDDLGYADVCIMGCDEITEQDYIDWNAE